VLVRVASTELHVEFPRKWGSELIFLGNILAID
jgi:hypothetical protein